MQLLIRITGYTFLFFLLTIVTQIGGIILLLSLALLNKVKREFRFKKTFLFLSLYLLNTLIFVPILAPFFGREKVRHQSNLSPTTYATVLLNRNYVFAKIKRSIWL